MSDCFCGSMFFPMGSKNAPGRSTGTFPIKEQLINDITYIQPDAGKGSFIWIESLFTKETDPPNNQVAVDLVHNQDIFLEGSQVFVTSTNAIPSESLYAHRIFICLGEDVNNIQINGMIRILVRVKETNKIIASKIIGESSESITYLSKHQNLPIQPYGSTINDSYKVRFPDTFSILLSDTDIIDFPDLNGKKLVIEFYSLCDRESPCCDKLPSELNLVNIVSLITCDGGVTTAPPFSQKPEPEISYYIVGKDEFNNDIMCPNGYVYIEGNCQENILP